MKSIVGIGKQWGCAYINRIVVLAERLDMFRLGLLLLMGRGSHKAICHLRKKLLDQDSIP
jgi:hypothetical protein